MSASVLPLEKLLQVRRVVVHKDCPDGMASAILLSDGLGMRTSMPGGVAAKIEFVQNNTPEHRELRPEPGLLLCDIAPHPERATEFAGSDEVIVLDHHASVREIVQACPYGVYASEDTGLSGATLAFLHVWKALHPDRHSETFRKLASDFAHLASIRDTFQRQDPRWTEACAQAEVLRFYNDPKYWVWNRAFRDLDWWKERMRLGTVLLDRRAASIQRDIASAYRFTTDKGTRVMVVAGLGQTSDISDIVTDANLVVGFLYTNEGGNTRMIVACRSQDRSFDCVGFSKAYGGGGHTAAAGFHRRVRWRDPQPYGFIRKLVERYEAPQPDAPPSA